MHELVVERLVEVSAGGGVGFLVVEGEQLLSLVCEGAESGLLTFDVGLDGLVAFDQSLTEESDDFVSGGFG